jgi:LCP family protein required for cell wall assembly
VTRAATRGRKVAVTVLSMLVFVGSWYGWSTINKVTSGLTTANVIDHSAPSTGPQNILLVGLDTRTDAQGNPLPSAILDQLHAGSASDGGDTTDTMIVIHIPAGGAGAVAFSIPRDSYVQLAGGYGKHKINSAYTYAQVAAEKQLRAQGVTGAQLAVQAAQAAAKNAIQTVEQFTGLQIDHFASVNLVGFYDISQAIGGVPVCLKAAVHDPYSSANFPAGTQTVSGAQALAFVRQRHGLPNGDLDRIKRQQVFMASMAHTVLSSGTLANPGTLNNLIGAIQKAVTIDQGWDVLSFARQLQGMSAGNLRFDTIPIVAITYPTPSDGDAVEVDPQQVQSFAQSLVNGQDAASPPATPPATAPPGSNSKVTAEVYNATSISGLATRVQQALTSRGFTAGTIRNASAQRRTTTIDYAPGAQAAALTVEQDLGGNITTVADTGLAADTVRIYLGADYHGPTGAASTVAPAPATPPSPTAPAPPAITAGGLTCVN